ncbi:DNA recombination protein RmuC [Amaricoccus solimangrovi]|uniref:DNA recombination protein RmuC homolog n=1 Tax=Amaricoccus solimangrovi TaxID=2589815 RepID=A0A501WVM9_9RHOB|nr:DNA recombination protein RmuC [Amaricoccus solimangrovi]TPE52184.1 DNA recombination protein RmuC [Amaricoccus solimangrovi]
MITIGSVAIGWDDPRLWIAVAAAAGFLMLLRATSRAGRATEPLVRHLEEVDGAIRALAEGQQRLHGGLVQVAETQASAQARVSANLETRLAEVTRALTESLGASAVRTARGLGELQERLSAIDKAQSNIEKLSSNVLGLQDILANKQTRGAFGEIQLREIVTRALPPDAASFQVTLSNGTRADCLIHLPFPPGPIAVDAKFPLEPYEQLRAARTPAEAQEAQRRMRAALRAHMKAIAEKYIIEGETAEGALMFLPSEAVYAEMHASFGEQVREGFALRVWTVSPTTCMATLHTLRAVLKDARMREEAHRIRRELGLLHKDVERLGARVGNLDRHFAQAQKDLEEIRISADRAGNRARRLEAIDFSPGEEAAGVEPAPRLVRLPES